MTCDVKKMNRTRLNPSTVPVRLGPQRLNIFLTLTSSFLLFSCAGSSHPQPISPSEGPVARRYLELYRGKQVATLHFPAGVYTLSAADKIGYYYRAPRKILEQGSIGRDGGIFVSKRDPNKLRGYIYRAGAITHVGNFSGTKYRFIEQDIPAAQY